MSVSINKGAGTVIVKLNRKFYDAGSIQRALEEFSPLCEGDFSKDDFEVMLKPKDWKTANKIGYEFCNYVFALMKNNNTV